MEEIRKSEKDLTVAANPNGENVEFAEIVVAVYAAIYPFNMSALYPYCYGSEPMNTICEIALEVANNKGINNESAPTAAAFAIGYLYTENGEFADKVSKAFGIVNTSAVDFSRPDCFLKAVKNAFIELKHDYLEWFNAKTLILKNRR
jgi:hypothetical protein